MDDLRLKTADVTVGGRTYKISCNMNVLADVQEMYDGNMSKALEDTTANGMRNFLTAMVNDARDSLGEGPLTAKQVGREISFSNAKKIVMPLILAAFVPSKNKQQEELEEKENGDEKNSMTTQSAE
ncbi:MAG: hypothetical protein IKU26_03380 [Clostridia bacterium]|nr:hypothetical protein [Clostridia bacterium]